MFTAIALIAFSSVSMGNTIVEENVVIENTTEDTSEVSEKLFVNNDPCQNVCHFAYDLARKEGASHAIADAYADFCYSNCIKSRKLIN